MKDKMRFFNSCPKQGRDIQADDGYFCDKGVLLRCTTQRDVVLITTDELQWICKPTGIITIVKSRRM